MLNVFGLFSGIGGFELGFQRAGCRIVGMCEIDPYCRAVLRKHWPNVPCVGDVRTVTGELLDFLDIRVDVLTGGFPCQDISLAGKGAGLDGERSGLWFEYRRIIEEVRPAWVVIENVSALRSRGLDVVLGSLAALGYDAEWHCIPAAAVGAPHRRDRIWIIAYPGGEGRRQVLRGAHGDEGADEGRAAQDMLIAGGDGAQRHVADADQHPRLARWLGDAIEGSRGRHAGRGGVGADELAHAEHGGRQGRDALRPGADTALSSGWWLSEPDVGRVAHGVPPRVDRLRALGNAVRSKAGGNRIGESRRGGPTVADADQPRLEIGLQGHAGQQSASVGGSWWLSEPDVGRVAHGVPSRVDRLRALGNAVVPQIPQMIAEAILAAEFFA